MHVIAVAAFLFQDPEAGRVDAIKKGLDAAQWLAGTWQGSMQGAMEGTGTDTWEPILDGCFLQSKEKWMRGEQVVHEATTLLTYDLDRRRLAAHVLEKTGGHRFYVGTLSDDGSAIMFNEPFKERLRTRFTIRRLSATELSGRYEVENEQGTWQSFVTWSMKKGP